jgi:tRNA(Ile2) C34 agmatinyltransferase TiaS
MRLVKMEIDSALDVVGINLETPVYCGSCEVRMEQINNTNFKCGKCGFVYNSK